jgi:hypothetical protein
MRPGWIVNTTVGFCWLDVGGVPLANVQAQAVIIPVD